MGNKYDYLIIGSGPAGHISALTAARAGLKTAIVEKDLNMLGGVCLNEGCIPAKSLFSGAYLFGAVKKFPGFLGQGVPPDVAMKEISAKSALASDGLKKGLLSHLKKSGIDIIEGNAQFKSGSEILVESPSGERSVIEAKKFLISAGSSPRALPGITFDGKSIISSSHAVKLEAVPEKILIIGAGAIGVEFASFFITMGSDVTLVEAQNEILPLEDRDVSSAMRNSLKKRGVKIITSSKIEEVSQKNGKVLAKISSINDGIFANEYSLALISVGREPNYLTLGLSKAGVNFNEKGFIPVGGDMQTNVKGIYAAGDIVPGPMLAHVAQAEGEIAALSAAGKYFCPLDISSIPNAVYSGVQAASVGLTEKQAETSGAEFIVGKSFFKANGKAVAAGEDEGFVKIIADVKTRKILGAHIVGHIATEVIHEFVIARRNSLKIDDIAWTVHAHPTFSESAALAAKDILFKL